MDLQAADATLMRRTMISSPPRRTCLGQVSCWPAKAARSADLFVKSAGVDGRSDAKVTYCGRQSLPLCDRWAKRLKDEFGHGAAVQRAVSPRGPAAHSDRDPHVDSGSGAGEKTSPCRRSACRTGAGKRRVETGREGPGERIVASAYYATVAALSSLRRPTVRSPRAAGRGAARWSPRSSAARSCGPRAADWAPRTDVTSGSRAQARRNGRAR
jgi:hypothetical protein